VVAARNVSDMRAWLDDRTGTVDAVVAGALLVVGLGTAHGVSVEGSSDAWYVRDLLILALFVPLVWRRRAPRLVLAIVVAATAGIWAGYFVDGGTAFAGGIAVYGVGRYVERPTSLRFFAVTMAFITIVAAAVTVAGSDGWYQFVARCGVAVAGFALGDSQRSRAELLASLRAQAERAESLRMVEAERAVIEERSRIAREMHDVVAHSLSVMVVQAVAAERLAPKQPEAALASMSSVAEVGRAALGEMRRIFDIFEHGAGPVAFAPQPTLTDLDAIIETFRTAGMDVTVHRIGTTPALDAGTELAIVRIVQESLTNVLKHADGADAVVTLSFADHITVEVTDGGTVRPPSTTANSGGRGLIGMRERVDALGGTITARHFAGRGFTVRAVLPIKDSSVPTTMSSRS